LVVHVIAGAIGILAGYIALSTVKGATVHRKSGTVFVYAMIIMALMGSTMAVVRNVAPGANTPVGLLTAYLVITGLTSVRPSSSRSRWQDPALMLVVLAVSITLLTFGIEAITSPKGKLYGMPSLPFFIFAAIGVLSAVGDFRLIRSGGAQSLRGAPRLARHLWRMNTALLIAAFSFFLGQAKVIPKPIRILPLLAIPPLVVFAALLYWLWRVRWRRSLRGIVVVRSPQIVR
jgi:hypothetical protein